MNLRSEKRTSSKATISPQRGSIHPIVAMGLSLVVSIWALGGGPFWDTKDWSKWSGTQCRELLAEAGLGSPWTAIAGAQNKMAIGYDLETDTIVQLRSAMPIRLALARKEQLTAKYDKMALPAKQVLDQKIQAELSQSMEDRVVLRIRMLQYGSGKRAVATPARSLVSVLMILADGTRINSTSVTPVRVQDGVDYDAIFPRVVNGRPIFKITDKKIIVSCDGCDGPLELNPSKMTFHGKLEY